MRFICAWCKKELREPTDTDTELISHGICQDCKKDLRQGSTEHIKFSRPGVSGLVNKN